MMPNDAEAEVIGRTMQLTLILRETEMRGKGSDRGKALEDFRQR